MSKLTTEQYYGQLVKVTAARSSCPRAAVGALLVDSVTGNILSTGYNGAPRGMLHCEDAGCILDAQGKCIRSVHAEANAILAASKTHGARLWCTHIPCFECCKLIIQAGIICVSYIYQYRDPRGQYFFSEEYSVDEYALNMQLVYLNHAGINVFVCK